MKPLLLTLAALVLLASPVCAQPSTAVFNATDTDFGNTIAYHLEFFQCSAPPVNGVCASVATTPFMAGMDIPIANIATLTTPDCTTQPCVNRTMSLLVPPASGYVNATPAGVYFLATLVAKGDPAKGLGDSPRSAASNPFLGHPQSLTPVSGLVVR